MRGGWVVAGLVALTAAASVPMRPGAAPLAAQDVEALAELRGLPVPPAYLEARARDSTAFTLPNGLFAVGADGAPRVVAREGLQRMLVIPTLFSDTPEPHLAASELQRILFDGPAQRGTLTEAYLEFSRGALTVEGTVTPWVRTSVTLDQAVGESSGLGNDTRLGQHLVEALEAVDDDIDFGLYDSDGPDGVPNSGDDDGWVDALAFEFLEVAASCGGPGVWPHRWGLTGPGGGEVFVSDDTRAGSDTLFVRANGYIIQSAVDCDGVQPQDASTIAHEYGHVLGLPDYYHPTDSEAGSFGRRWVLGCWGLMAAGAWGCGEHAESRAPFGPTHLSARSKFRLDWVEYDQAGEGVGLEYVLHPVQSSGRALRVPLDAAGEQQLLLEYRTLDGFDAELPAEGVLIYRQDNTGLTRPPPGSGIPYFLSLVEQDGDDGLLRNSLEGGDRGRPGDAWGRPGTSSRLNGTTSPGTLLRDGRSSGVAIHSVTLDDGVAYVRLSRSPEPGVALPDAPLSVDPAHPLDAVLTVGGGAMPYALEATLPAGFEASVEEDELRLEGEPAEGDGGAGVVVLELELVDARGVRSGAVRIPVETGPWLPDEARLVQPFLQSGAEPLTEAERGYLDFVGNRNGGYDVGDLRAWLRDGTPSGE